MRSTWAAVRAWGARAGDRLAAGWYRIVLAALTASAAWVLAQQLLGQPSPIFAPIAAVVCLTDAAGTRGRRALRLLGGVCVGVVVGEAAARVIGTGWLQVALAVLAGMLVSALGSINSLTLLQAGIASLLVVGLSSPQTGWTRLADALVGGVLALLVSQVLATPSPARFLADAAGRALGPPAAALEETAAALRVGSVERVRAAGENLRKGHETLAAFLDTRAAADSMAATTLRGRHERRRVRALQARFGGVEYVYAGSVLLTRTATEVVDRGDDVPDDLVAGVESLARTLRAVAARPEPPRDGDGDGDGDGSGFGPADTGPPEVPLEVPPDREPSPARLVAQLGVQLRVLGGDVAALDAPSSAPGPHPGGARGSGDPAPVTRGP